jgi:hypothetical protein
MDSGTSLCVVNVLQSSTSRSLLDDAHAFEKDALLHCRPLAVPVPVGIREQSTKLPRGVLPLAICTDISPLSP